MSACRHHRHLVFDKSFHGRVGEFPADAGPEWLQTHEFIAPFNVWQRELEERRDAFLGYCGAPTATAHAIKRYLSEQGVTVLDWQTDLKAVPRDNVVFEAGYFIHAKGKERVLVVRRRRRASVMTGKPSAGFGYVGG